MYYIWYRKASASIIIISGLSKLSEVFSCEGIMDLLQIYKIYLLQPFSCSKSEECSVGFFYPSGYDWVVKHGRYMKHRSWRREIEK